MIATLPNALGMSYIVDCDVLGPGMHGFGSYLGRFQVAPTQFAMAIEIELK